MRRAQRWWAGAVAAAAAILPAAAPLAAPAGRSMPAAVPTAAAPAVELPAPAGLAPVATAEQAAREAQRANGGGRVLAVDSTPEGFRVKLIKHGDVRVVLVPAAGH